MKRYGAWAALLICLVSLGLSCGGGKSVPTSDVAGAAPWQAPESLGYVVVNKKGDVLGHETLSVEQAGSVSTLSQSFRSETNSDDSAVKVEGATLKPISSTRRVVSPSDDETIEVEYTEAGALIKQGDKQSGLSVPEHAYDNDTSLFLWRTLPFAPGYEGAYVTIITNRRSKQTVTLRLLGEESVTVPAGTFAAWKLQIETSNAKQTAWYAQTPTRPLLKYDNDRDVIFELEKAP